MKESGTPTPEPTEKPMNQQHREANLALAHGVRVRTSEGQSVYYDHGRPQTHEIIAAEREQLAGVREQLKMMTEASIRRG